MVTPVAPPSRPPSWRYSATSMACQRTRSPGRNNAACGHAAENRGSGQAPDQMPATGALVRIDGGQRAGGRHAACRHTQARFAATGARQHCRQITHEWKTGQEAEHVDLAGEARMQAHHLCRRQSAGCRQVAEIGATSGELIAIADRQLPKASAAPVQRHRCAERGADAGLDGCTAGQQRVVDDGQRTESRHRFDDSAQATTRDGLRQGHIEGGHRGQQASLDTVAELDGQRRIAGVEETKAHPAIIPSRRIPGPPTTGAMAGIRATIATFSLCSPPGTRPMRAARQNHPGRCGFGWRSEGIGLPWVTLRPCMDLMPSRSFPPSSGRRRR
jgi:hypothetical protein